LAKGSLIGKTGIADVVKPLKENTHVRHVDLASNGLNELGATQIAQVCPASFNFWLLLADTAARFFFQQACPPLQWLMKMLLTNLIAVNTLTFALSLLTIQHISIALP